MTERHTFIKVVRSFTTPVKSVRKLKRCLKILWYIQHHTSNLNYRLSRTRYYAVTPCEEAERTSLMIFSKTQRQLIKESNNLKNFKILPSLKILIYRRFQKSMNEIFLNKQK